MRLFWAYALSGILHLLVLGALALWLPPLPHIEIRLRRGDSVVLSAAFSQPAAPASESPTVTIPVSEPLEIAPAPEIEPTESEVVPVELSAPPIEVERSEYQVDRAPALREVVTDEPAPPTPSPQPSKATTPAEPQPDQLAETAPPTPQRTVTPELPTPVGEASAAMPFQTAADLGSEVDQLPSQFPNNRKPPYPLDALRDRIEGVVRLRVQIDAAGRVTEVALHRSSGSPSLDQSAISGVRQWRFSPARRGGLAVPYEVIVPVRFSIRS